jgi:cell division protein FtsW (lipid II flippase)
MTSTLPDIAAIAATIGFLGIAVFQAALVLGAPLGHAAWGGKHRRLPTSLRIGSTIAIVIWLLAAVIVLASAGFDVPSPPEAVRRWAIWVVVGLLAVGTIMNAASPSRWERFIWAPVSLALALLTIVVALG